MFGFGMPEIIIILVLTLIFFGPQKLPELAKMLGKGMGEFKRATEDIQGSIMAGIDTDRASSSVVTSVVDSDTESPPKGDLQSVKVDEATAESRPGPIGKGD